MKKALWISVTILLGFSLLTPSQEQRQEKEIWRDFVTKLRDGHISTDDIRPHEFVSRESQLRILNIFRSNAVWEEWEAEPEIIRWDNNINYIIPLKGAGSSEPVRYCFMLILEEERWFFRHVETIFVRLDKLPPLPVSGFPDIGETQKQWAREEIRWSEKVRIFHLISAMKNREAALNFFKDGAGYFLGAKTWVPFVPPRRAFILYLCWEQSNLRGSRVVLEALEDNEAVVKLDPLPYRIFRSAAHLREQIDFSDYRAIFETIWQNRAEAAGWNLEIKIQGPFTVLHFLSPGQ